ncbi:stage V sporulation protein AA [Natranaerovirga hydrolytica]|uniref:Stage V sporulation protein AA n=1 Tax=Natranaerovirga hydrolytica TaxID=680378 RepID=A0A4R1MK92_9FIRM|nr:stage V sporulation protein AA [Natranaerovirga hydrolytica]TCK92440.1 stage V sporulation protein AA [Natranaerovirga hydrolytica]
MKSKNIYFKASKKTIINKKNVKIEDIAKLEGDDEAVINKIKKLPVLTITEDVKKNYVVSILEVIKIIQAKVPNVDIQNIGEADFIICYWPNRKNENKLLTYIKVICVCMILFTGGAIAIMTFHTDAAVPDVFKELYRIFTGVTTENPTLLEISYSIGLALGIIVFFNHFTNVKIMDDPTPIEVEMRSYEKDVEDSIIESLVDEGENIDVD